MSHDHGLNIMRPDKDTQIIGSRMILELIERSCQANENIFFLPGFRV